MATRMQVSLSTVVSTCCYCTGQHAPLCSVMRHKQSAAPWHLPPPPGYLLCATGIKYEATHLAGSIPVAMATASKPGSPANMH
mmetsp:Transcript_34819/g.77407  ORF Transcript_34819/g.77407 Transcript_34819/m.77407 type:complete len:83 (-) Transcript_34819:1167-1415(-)